LRREEVLPHRRAGDLVLQAAPDAWFDYRWWQAAEQAPTFAKLVDIHRKPGYDPLELFFDPAVQGVAQDPARLRGSHGRVDGADPADVPVLVGRLSARADPVGADDVAQLVDQLVAE
jgi:hypothetical protein